MLVQGWTVQGGRGLGAVIEVADQAMRVTRQGSPADRLVQGHQRRSAGERAGTDGPAHDSCGVRVGGGARVGETAGSRTHIRDVGHVKRTGSVEPVKLVV